MPYLVVVVNIVCTLACYRKSGIFHLFSKYIKEKFTIGNIHILLLRANILINRNYLL